ncbi:imelysin family protein [Parvicella tangerina]|uniref:Imelysin-like domain-containing protein n=1 Tax=Parvicella tangerina TaxID=2829795 RepID=A0A916JK44_9FLAO|nr:imelysin family protein [Parvicella tangerina]CAG5076282.1 hypothetical protein CRYO30217_00037 [Parvicella tangerina]
MTCNKYLNSTLKNSVLISFLLLILGSLVSCIKEPEDNVYADDFDREAMLKNIASEYIIPGYNSYVTEVDSLEGALLRFNSSPTLATVQELRDQYIVTLKSWQTVSFLDFGPANVVALVAQTNTYPVDTTLIQTNITQGGYSLAAGNQYVAKGWQSLDYLLFKESDLQGCLDYLNSDPNIVVYIADVIDDIQLNTRYVINSWSTYKTEFIDNNLSNATGSSVSELMNAVIQSYEIYTRKGKIGLPAGVFNGFSQQPMPANAEGYFMEDKLDLARQNVSYLKRFLNGMNYEGTTDGLGLLDYGDYVEATIDGDRLSQVINSQLDVIMNISETNGLSWAEMVVQDPVTSQAIYTEYQKLIPYLKVDLTSALGVIVTYQDNDGD